MSLWVEFITASGYLSARKIRSRFQTLVAQAVDKCAYRDCVKMIADTTEVKLRIRERLIVQITPAFKCAGLWPRSAAHWPLPQIPWPHPNVVAEVKTEGFDMLSKVKSQARNHFKSFKLIIKCVFYRNALHFKAKIQLWKEMLGCSVLSRQKTNCYKVINNCCNYKSGQGLN